MAAPSGTVWGAISGSGTRQGRLGLYFSTSSTQTVTTVTVQLWYATKWSCYDSSNEFKMGWGGTASTSVGAHSISHSVESGSGWSGSNQTLIGTYTKQFTRGTANSTARFTASFSGIEVGGGSGSVSSYVTVPARNRYSISYNANGGTGAPSTQYYYYGYDTTISKTIPTRVGYDFLGWSLSSTATEPSYFPGKYWSGVNASNFTFYAVWQRKVLTATFDAGYNGGTVQESEEIQKSYYYGDSLGQLPVAHRENYKFVQWNTKADGTGDRITESTQIYENIKVYAIYELQANCYIRISGTYKAGMMYKKVDGVYKTGTISVKDNGTYKGTNM